MLPTVGRPPPDYQNACKLRLSPIVGCDRRRDAHNLPYPNPLISSRLDHHPLHVRGPARRSDNVERAQTYRFEVFVPVRFTRSNHDLALDFIVRDAVTTSR